MTIRKQDEEFTLRRIPAGCWIALVFVLIGIVFIRLAPELALPELAQNLWRWIGIVGEPLQPLATLIEVLSFLGIVIPPLQKELGSLIRTLWRTLTGRDDQAPKLVVTFVEWLAERHNTVLIVFVVSLMFYILTITAPLFKITNPKNGATIVSTARGVTVEGKGAKPGGTVAVYVFDSHEKYLQEGDALVDQRGYWSIDNVILQRENYPYMIWAETTEDGVSVITVNRPRVTRTTSAKPYRAIIGFAIVLILLVIIGVRWILPKRR